MNILIYNWSDYLNNPKRGGGVTVYLARLVSELKKNHNLYFVSSGEAYNPFKSNPYWTKRRGEKNVDVYEIVNSEVMAPANLEFGSVSVLHANKTLAVWGDLLNKIKPDVVHFHNIEGLPLKAINVNFFLPNCLVFYSLHNYYGFCANVKLWRDNESNCNDLTMKASCYQCCKLKPNIHIEYKVKVLKWAFRLIRLEVPKWIFKYALTVDFISIFPGRTTLSNLILARDGKQNNIYYEIKEQFVFYLNNHVDSVLPVSNRVLHIAEKHGVYTKKMSTCYIGTEFVDNVSTGYNRYFNRKPATVRISVVYMGYMVKEKGFDFFIDALSLLPHEQLAKIDLTIAARNTSEDSYKKMLSLSTLVGSFRYFDGYSKLTMHDILDGADLSVVPVLWEDNLPQVAMESVMFGVPILVSDLGGAQELVGNNPMFIFKHGDKVDFLAKIRIFINDKNLTNAFWLDNMKINSINEHVIDILKKYKAERIC